MTFWGDFLHYFLFENAENDVVYSVDKVCVMGDLEFRFIENFSHELSNFFMGEWSLCKRDLKPWSDRFLKDYKSYTRYGIGEYKNNLSIVLSLGSENSESSFYFGYKHNSNKIGACSWKIELNPNKCLPCDFVDDFLRFVMCRSKSKTLRISQADFAFDFKLPRKNFYLEKDKRIYSTCNDGADNITEYLSRHNSNGFCKLYNKSFESHLDYDLTRFEITLQDFSYSNICSVFPNIHYIDYSQILLNETLPKLSQNDEIFVELLRLHPDKFQYLSRRKKQVFRPYLNYDSPLYKLDWIAMEKLINRMLVYFIG